MKCQILLSGKNKENISLLSAESAKRVLKVKALFSSPVPKYRKSYCTTLGVIGGGGINKKMLKFYVKVFKTLYFLNPQMDLLYTWYDYRCWSKILFSTI